MSSDKPEEPAAYSSLYFDPLNADEESIHEIDPEIQERIRKIEEIYQSLIPTKVQDMAYEKSMIERTKLKIKHDDTFVYGEMVSYLFIPDI